MPKFLLRGFCEERNTKLIDVIVIDGGKINNESKIKSFV